MPANLISKNVMKDLAAEAAGLDNNEGQCPRLKEVIEPHPLPSDAGRSTTATCRWTSSGPPSAIIGQAGKNNEFGLIVPGVALEHFLDLRLDEAETLAGLSRRHDAHHRRPALRRRRTAQQGRGPHGRRHRSRRGLLHLRPGSRRGRQADRRRHRRHLARQLEGRLLLHRRRAGSLQSAPPHRDRRQGSLRCSHHRAERLWLPAGERDAQADEPARPPCRAPRPRPLLRLGTRAIAS